MYKLELIKMMTDASKKNSQNDEGFTTSERVSDESTERDYE